MKPPTKSPAAFWSVYALCLFTYMSAYFGRVNLSISLPYLQDALGYSRGALGIMASGFFGTYAVGQLINGILGDRFNPHRFVGIGLLAAGISNILLGLSNSLPLMILLWTVNGYFQSMLWGPILRIVTGSAPPKHLQKSVLYLAAAPVLGYLFAYTLVGRFTAAAGWRSAFLVPGGFLVLTALFWLWYFRTYGRRQLPRNAGVSDSVAAPSEIRHGSTGIVFFIRRSRIWIAAILCIAEGAVKEGLTLWGPTLFAESRSLDMEQVLFIMSLAPLINLLAITLGGIINRQFRYREKYTIIIFAAISILFAVLLRFSLGGSILMMGIAFCGLLAGKYAVNNMLTAFVPLNFRGEGRVSTAAGLMDCSVYTGAALSGPVSGMIADRSGWTGVIICWIVLCVVSLILGFCINNYRAGRVKNRRYS